MVLLLRRSGVLTRVEDWLRLGEGACVLTEGVCRLLEPDDETPAGLLWVVLVLLVGVALCTLCRGAVGCGLVCGLVLCTDGLLFSRLLFTAGL